MERTGEEVSEARDSEEIFDEEGAENQKWEVGNDQSDEGDQSIFENMGEEESIVIDSLSASGSDIVAGDFFEKNRPINAGFFAEIDHAED